MQGVVRIYDPKTGFGVIVRDDGNGEILLGPGSLEGSLFRTLRQGQRIVFDTRTEGDQIFAQRVRFGSDGY